MADNGTLTIELSNGRWSVDLSRRLGKPGGFGDVFAGFGPHGEPVAIKRLRAEPGVNTSRELLFAEAFAVRETRNIVPILDFGIDGASGAPCIVMAQADGNLRSRLAEGPIGTESEIASVLLDIAGGLIEAGEWIHRDLKPENVLLHEDRWKVADFSIARLADADTSNNTLMGYLTPQYASPEQWDGRRVTHASDVYALGCVGYEMLMGNPPFDGPTNEDFAEQHRIQNPNVSSVFPATCSLILRMLAKPMRGRPSLEAVVQELTSIRNRAAATAGRPSLLASAGAAVAEETSKRQAAEVKAAEKNFERLALQRHAHVVLRPIAEELFRRIKEEAPNTDVRSLGRPGYPTFDARLLDGTLSMTVGHFAEVSREVFDGCSWDVLCGDIVMVQAGRYIRSASLWYTDKGTGNYGWWEAAYWSFNPDRWKQPCYLHPGRDAALAASNALHRWSFAYPPKPVDGENAEKFYIRWMDFFAQAALGQLKPPGSLPEE